LVSLSQECLSVALVRLSSFPCRAPAGQPPQSVTFPNGTTFGGASGRQASELAQIVVDSNNNMRDYQQLQ
jgi:hypothetical protein